MAPIKPHPVYPCPTCSKPMERAGGNVHVCRECNESHLLKKGREKK